MNTFEITTTETSRWSYAVKATSREEAEARFKEGCFEPNPILTDSDMDSIDSVEEVS